MMPSNFGESTLGIEMSSKPKSLLKGALLGGAFGSAGTFFFAILLMVPSSLSCKNPECGMGYGMLLAFGIIPLSIIIGLIGMIIGVIWTSVGNQSADGLGKK